MFCGNCGSQNPDGLTKCAVCGAPLTQDGAAKKPGKAGLNLGKNKLTGYAIIAAVVVVVIVLLIVIFSGRSDTSALKQYVKASFDLDAEKLIDLSSPKGSIKAYAEENDISKGDAKEELVDDCQELLDSLEDLYGDDIDFEDVKSISIDIRDEDKLTKKEVREANETLEDQDVDMTIKEAKTVDIKVTGKYDGDKFSFRIDGIYMIKVGGSWYIFYPSPESLFSALVQEID